MSKLPVPHVKYGGGGLHLNTSEYSNLKKTLYRNAKPTLVHMTNKNFVPLMYIFILSLHLNIFHLEIFVFAFLVLLLHAEDSDHEDHQHGCEHRQRGGERQCGFIVV